MGDQLVPPNFMRNAGNETYLIDAFDEVGGRCADTLVNNFVCNAICVFSVLAEVAIDFFRGGLERVWITVLDRIKSHVCKPVRTGDHRSEASLDGL